MVGQHIYMRCARGYFATQGHSDQIGMKTAAMTDGLLPMNVVLAQIEPKCNLDEPFARKLGLLNKRASILTLYHPRPDVVAFTRNSWVTNVTNDAREGVYAFSQIATERDCHAAMDDCARFFNPDAYEPYQFAAKRMQMGGGAGVGLDPAYDIERAAPITAPNDAFDNLGIDNSAFCAYVNMLLQVLSGECKRVAVVMPASSEQRWLNGERDDAERLLLQTLRLLPRFLRKKLTATTHSSASIGANQRDIMLFFLHDCGDADQFEDAVSRQMAAWIDLRSGTNHVPTKSPANRFAQMLWGARRGDFARVAEFEQFLKKLFGSDLGQVQVSPRATELCMQLWEADLNDAAQLPDAIRAGAQLFAGQTHSFPEAEALLAQAASRAAVSGAPWTEDSLRAVMALLSRAANTGPMDAALYNILLCELGKDKGDAAIVELLEQECAKKPAACEAVDSWFASLMDSGVFDVPMPMCELTLKLAGSRNSGTPSALQLAHQWMMRALKDDEERRILALTGYTALCAEGRLEAGAAEKYCRVLLDQEYAAPGCDQAAQCLEHIEKAAMSSASLASGLADQFCGAALRHGGIDYLARSDAKDRFYRLLRLAAQCDVLMDMYRRAMNPPVPDGKDDVRAAFTNDQLQRFARMAESGEAGAKIATDLELINLQASEFAPEPDRIGDMLNIAKRFVSLSRQEELADSYYASAVRRGDTQAIGALKAKALLPGIYVRQCAANEQDQDLEWLEGQLSADAQTRALMRDAGWLTERAIKRNLELLDAEARLYMPASGDQPVEPGQMSALVSVYWKDFEDIQGRRKARGGSQEELSAALEQAAKDVIMGINIAKIARYMPPEGVVRLAQIIYPAYRTNEGGLRTAFNVVRMVDEKKMRDAFYYLEDLAARHGSDPAIRSMVCSRLLYHLNTMETKYTIRQLGMALWYAMFEAGIGEPFDARLMLNVLLPENASREERLKSLILAWLKAESFTSGLVGLVRNVLGEVLIDAAEHDPKPFDDRCVYDLYIEVKNIDPEYWQALHAALSGKKKKLFPLRSGAARICMGRDCLGFELIPPPGAPAVAPTSPIPVKEQMATAQGRAARKKSSGAPDVRSNVKASGDESERSTQRAPQKRRREQHSPQGKDKNWFRGAKAWLGNAEADPQTETQRQGVRAQADDLKRKVRKVKAVGSTELKEAVQSKNRRPPFPLLYTTIVAFVFLVLGILSTSAILRVYRMSGLRMALSIEATCILVNLVVGIVWLAVIHLTHDKKGR